jgi:hypothetical protein
MQIFPLTKFFIEYSLGVKIDGFYKKLHAHSHQYGRIGDTSEKVESELRASIGAKRIVTLNNYVSL